MQFKLFKVIDFEFWQQSTSNNLQSTI